MRRLLFTILSICVLSVGAFAQTPGSPGGLVVFETLNSTLTSNPSQANVLAGAMTTQSLLFATSSARLSRTLAVAIANPGNTAAHVTLTLRRGTDGVVTTTKILTVGATQQSSIFLNEFYAGLVAPPADFDGTLSVTSDNPVAITAFRFRGDNFTTIPVTSLSASTPVPQISAAVGGTDAVIIPHFATGNSWSSQIILSNTNAVPMTVRIDLFQQDGTPYATTMNGVAGSSFLNVVIPALGIVTESTDASGALRSGYAVVTPVSSAAAFPTVLSTIPSAGAVNVPINQKLSAVFSKAMDPATIIAANFTLTGPGTTPVLGAVAYDAVNNIATFAPTSNLAVNTTFTATITTGVKDLAGNAMASNASWTFTTGASTNVTNPTVTSVDPANLATGVSINKALAATFSKAMDPLTINSSTFTLQGPGTTAVAGGLSYNAVNNTATFTPLFALAANTLYTATITTGAKDLLGNALATNFVWSFTTAATSLPTVLSTIPAAGALNVPTNQKLSAVFSKAMNPATIIAANFTLTGPGTTSVLGAVTYDAVNNVATFAPTSNLAINTTFTATITTGVKDLAGNAMASNASWTFTTGAATNVTNPTVTSVDPANLATGVSFSKAPAATFSTAMDPLTITSATFTLQGPGTTAVAGGVSYNVVGNTATFTPSSNLAGNTLYTATVTTGAKDLLGNALASNFVWTFTTGGGAHTGPLNVALGAASPYGILGGSGVTNSGPTIINGSLGTSPTGTLTGAPVVTGSTDLANPAAAAAKLALTAAFNDAAGRSANAIALPGNLSGLTLAPGLYTNSTSVILSAGNVTLDAQGDSSATWIFQMGSTLTTIAGTQVVLAGGAKADNIFWEVGSSATLGTTSIFKGNILASISISANTGAVIEGRLLTQTGAVSLLSNIVTVPTP